MGRGGLEFEGSGRPSHPPPDPAPPTLLPSNPKSSLGEVSWGLFSYFFPCWNFLKLGAPTVQIFVLGVGGEQWF